MRFARLIAGRLGVAALTLGLCGATLPAAALAASASAHAQATGGAQWHSDPQAHKHTSATLEACLASTAAGTATTRTGVSATRGRASATQTTGASTTQAGGSATFAAQMTALPGAYELEMRFEILERQPGQAAFHRPPGPGTPGLGSWRVSGPHVAVLKDFDEVTNLAAPALYKARIRFRWLDSEGHPFHWAERETEPCRQLASAAQTAAWASR